MPAENVTCSLQLASQRLEIVNLAIERQHVTPIRRVHGLMPLDAQINNRQTTMSQGHAGCSVRPGPFVVGTAMRQRGSHAPDELTGFVHAAIPRRLKESCNATHKCLPR